MPTNSEFELFRNRVSRPGKQLVVLLGSFTIAVGFLGCGPPQVEPAHREMILKLATATSNSDLQLLDRSAEEVERLRAEGTLDSTEESAFLAIIDSARSGDWEKARRRAYALRDAQRPTKDDVERLKTRPLPPPKTLSKGVPQV